MKRLLLFACITVIALTGLTDAAAQMRKVRVGTEGAYPPFNYIDASGKVVGFDVDIANALCKAANFECTFVIQDWDGLIPGLAAKKFDAIVASVNITEAREKVVDFTDKYYQTPARFVAKKGSNFDVSREGLAGKKVAVQRATIQENFLRANFDKSEILVYATQDEASADLVSGRVDLFMSDSVALLEGFLKKPAGANCEFVGPVYFDKKYLGRGAGIAIRKGEQDLVNAFNDAIKKIRADGTYKAINSKYFDFDVYGD
jgi:arginine/ornithine transport system substrate-binding protein